MSNESNKTIITISYILNVLLIIALVIALKGGFRGIGGSEQETYASIKESIVYQEKAELPLTIQKLKDVHEIVIDSLVLVNNVEPYQGYLVTQWKYDTWGKKGIKKQVLVEVSDIKVDDDTISWETNWPGAHLSIL